jgi:archaemetzincin
VNGIELIRTADLPPSVAERAAAGIGRVFREPCHARAEAVALAVPPDPARNQYSATAILQSVLALEGFPGHVLAITARDLFVPVLTFVFGEAQMPGRCAVVSIHRLQEEFYGLPSNDALLYERLLKEAVHELGHTYGLLHCDDWECVMSSSHGVERIDIKKSAFCGVCRRRLSGHLSRGRGPLSWLDMAAGR